MYLRAQIIQPYHKTFVINIDSQYSIILDLQKREQDALICLKNTLKKITVKLCSVKKTL